MSHPFERYHAAVMDHPRHDGEGAFTYVARIAAIVNGEPIEAVKSWPAERPVAEREVRLPYPDDAE